MSTLRSLSLAALALVTLLDTLPLAAAEPAPASPAPANPAPTNPPATAAPAAAPPRVLLVTAHPDDDALFCASVYKITHSLGGTVDLALVTNGEGGYKYSTLAEPIYGLQLTDEAVGRAYLPGIRKRELMAGGAVVGIRNYFFLDQLDSAYTLDMSKIFAGEWNVTWVKQRLAEIMQAGHYDFIFTMLPSPSTHAGHRAAAILALQAVASLPEDSRPIVLSATARVPDRPAEPPFTGLEGYPETQIRAGSPTFEFDRSQKFGYDNRLDYNIIANWVIAEHKSQGTMQLLAGRNVTEIYLYPALNPEAGLERARTLFDQLHTTPPHRWQPPAGH